MAPYQYAANNPLLFVDVNGDSLEITDTQTQQDFINTLPENVADYIRFNENGVLDIYYLKSSMGDYDVESLGINLRAAILIGENETMVQMHGTDKMQYLDKNGNMTTLKMSDYATAGFTTAPDGSNMQSVVPGKVDVRINRNLSPMTSARSIAHELYGHARFYLEGRDWQHDLRKNFGGYDFNRVLLNATKKHQIKAAINYMMRVK
jgi:hypothetical protein